MAISYEPELLLARDQGLKLVSIGALVQRPLTSIIALPGPARAAAWPTSPARRVGTAGIPYQAAELRTALQSAGVNPASVHEVNVGFNLVPAMLSGQGGRDARRLLELRGDPAAADAQAPGRDPRRPGRRAAATTSSCWWCAKTRRAAAARTCARSCRRSPAASARCAPTRRRRRRCSSRRTRRCEAKLQLESIGQTLPAAQPANPASRTASRTRRPGRLRRLDVRARLLNTTRTPGCRRSPTSSCPGRASREVTTMFENVIVGVDGRPNGRDAIALGSRLLGDRRQADARERARWRRQSHARRRRPGG